MTSGSAHRKHIGFKCKSAERSWLRGIRRRVGGRGTTAGGIQGGRDAVGAEPGIRDGDHETEVGRTLSPSSSNSLHSVEVVVGRY